MRFSGIIITGLLVFGALAVWGFSPKSVTPERRFEAHEFAEFRSRYDSLRVQSPDKRVEHFRSLLEATEGARLTAGMVDTLVEFCRAVVVSGEEASSVQAEARLVMNTLEARSANRAPASDISKK